MQKQQQRLHRAYTTVIEMCIDRNYFISKEKQSPSPQHISELFIQWQQNQGFFILLNHRTENHHLLIYFKNEQKQIHKDDIKEFLVKMNKQKIKRGIIVSNNSLSTICKKLLTTMKVDYGYFVEHFVVEDLLINITKHSLVPKHVKASEEEKKLVLKKYRAKVAQMPKILVGDPVARYLGLRRGDMVKIYRKSDTCGTHVFYRIAV